MWKRKTNYLILYSIMGASVCVTSLGVKAASVEAAAPSVGSPIAPSGKAQTGNLELRTPKMMAEDEVYLSAPLNNEEVKPFMPIDEGYWYEKANANAQSNAIQGRRNSPASQVPSAPTALAPPVTTGVNFEGINQTNAGGGYPPDTHGAVSESYFVEIVNFRVVVYNKAGTLLRSTALNAFFGSTEFVFDPRIVYDQTWKRFVISASIGKKDSTKPRFLLAISRTSDPLGAWWTYSAGISGSFSGGSYVNGDWVDYPGLGMDQDAVLLTANIFTFGNAYKTTVMIPIAKARLYNGLGWSAPVFGALAPTLQPPIVTEYDQNNKAYFVAANNNALRLYRGENLSNPNQATLVLQSNIPAAFAVPPDARQLGAAKRLDTLDGRFVNSSTQYGDSLWNVHTVNLGGYPTPKFYQIDTEGAGVNTFKQSGYFYDRSTSEDFNASIAANRFNEVFVTWNSTDVANATVAERHNVRIRMSGRQPADPAGVIPRGTSLWQSSSALTGNGVDLQRWGDYSAVSLDPSTTATCSRNRRAWVVNEKINSASVWGSRVARIGFCN